MSGAKDLVKEAIKHLKDLAPDIYTNPNHPHIKTALLLYTLEFDIDSRLQCSLSNSKATIDFQELSTPAGVLDANSNTSQDDLNIIFLWLGAKIVFFIRSWSDLIHVFFISRSQLTPRENNSNRTQRTPSIIVRCLLTS